MGSRICTGKFHRVNCASFEKNLAESELFGHEKGAFTGAIEKKVGIVKDANNGLLVLDEIGELSEEVQAKLLIFIEEGSYRSVGSNKNEYANVKIIGTTNKAKDFRNDFWFRFYPIFIPALHERRTDVLYYIAQKYPQIFYRLSNQHVLSMLAHNWPGNIREVERVASIMTYEDLYAYKESFLNSRRLGSGKVGNLIFPTDSRQTSLANICLDKFYRKLYMKCYPIDMLNYIIDKYGLQVPESELSVGEIMRRNYLIDHEKLHDYRYSNEDISRDQESRMLFDEELDVYYFPSEAYEYYDEEGEIISPTPKISVDLVECDKFFKFERIYITKPNIFIEKSGFGLRAMCMLFLKNVNSVNNIFEADDLHFDFEPWENDPVQDIMAEFHECGLIKFTMEHIFGYKMDFSVKFSFKYPWRTYLEGLLVKNQERLEYNCDVAKSGMFNGSEKELMRQYYEYLRGKYRTVRDASKHAGVNESTFRNKLRHYGLLDCQAKGGDSEK